MSEKVKDYLPELLNRVEAIIDCEAGTISGLADFIFPDKPKRQAITRIAEYIRQRNPAPNGETSLRLRDWAAAKTLEIGNDAKVAKAYRKAFKAVQTRRA